MPESPAESVPSQGIADRRWVTAAVLLVMMLVSLEMTVTSTAMPTIIGQLHGLEHYAWVASIYLLASTVTMPMFGRLSDAFGRKRVFLAAIVLFCTGSLLCSLARTMPQLIVFRGLQGLGAGGVMPVALTIVGDIYTLRERARIQAVFSAVWGGSALAGPAVGAFMVLHLGWPSIFYVNLPFGILGMIVLITRYHERQAPAPSSLDVPGTLALVVGCTSLLALVSRLGPGGWTLQQTLVLTAVAIGTLSFFAWHELRVAAPLMNPRLLAQRDIAPSLAGNFFLGMAFMCLDTFVPLYVQGARGGGATAAAGVVTPILLTWAISGIIAAPLIVRFGFRTTTLLGGACLLAGLTGLLLGARYNLPARELTLSLAVAGLGMGPCSMGYMLGAQEAVDYQQRGSVTSAVTFFRTMGGAIGVGTMGALFNFLMLDDLEQVARHGGSPGAALDPTLHHTLGPDVLAIVQDGIAHSLLWVFVGMLIFGVIQTAISGFMTNRRPPREALREAPMD
jgi:MFS family permease